MSSVRTTPSGHGGRRWIRPQPPRSIAILFDSLARVVLEANSPRLDLDLGQAYLVLSNQVDSTQVRTQFFSTTADWINAARAEYCDTRSLPGVHWFLPARAASVHVITPNNPRFTGAEADMVLSGTTMADWIEGVLTASLAVPDLIEEGTIVADIPGVNAFPCSIPERRGAVPMEAWAWRRREVFAASPRAV